jgi:hypothetical protein
MADLNPLEQLLTLLGNGKPYSLDDLVRSLDVDHGLLEQMLGQLQQVGYIRPLEMSCERACDHCGDASLCAITHGKRVWTVTARGWRAIRQATPQ